MPSFLWATFPMNVNGHLWHFDRFHLSSLVAVNRLFFVGNDVHFGHKFIFLLFLFNNISFDSRHLVQHSLCFWMANCNGRLFDEYGRNNIWRKCADEILWLKMLFRINCDSESLTHEKTLLSTDMMKPTKESAKVDNGPHIFLLNNHSKWTKSRKTKCINIFQENLWERMDLGTSFNWLNGFNFFSLLLFHFVLPFFLLFSFCIIDSLMKSTNWLNLCSPRLWILFGGKCLCSVFEISKNPALTWFVIGDCAIVEYRIQKHLIVHRMSVHIHIFQCSLLFIVHICISDINWIKWRMKLKNKPKQCCSSMQKNESYFTPNILLWFDCADPFQLDPLANWYYCIQ